MERLVLPGLGCPARVYAGAVVAYDPELTVGGNAAAIRASLTEPTILVGHSMGGVIASLVGGPHPVINIEGLPDRPSVAAEQLAVGGEPTAASPLWRGLLAECDPELTGAMARHYVEWMWQHRPIDAWRRITNPKLYVYGLGPGGRRVATRAVGIPGAGHFPMIDRPKALDAVVNAFEHELTRV